jgi:hypothetical protein
VEAQKK